MNLNEAKYKLNKEIPIPLYFQVKRMILNELSNGNIKQGDKLPGETEFCECLGLSRPTVRQALNELVSEGILIRKKKSGTFIAQPKIALTIHTSVESLKRCLENSGRECEVTVLDLCVVDGIEEINTKLNMDPHSQLIYLKRLWKVGATPVVYSASYLSFEKFELILEKDFTELNLFEFLKLNYELDVRNRISKIESTLASKNDLELLEINRTRASLLCVTDVMEDDSSVALSYSVTRYRGDKVYLSYCCEV